MQSHRVLFVVAFVTIGCNGSEALPPLGPIVPVASHACSSDVNDVFFVNDSPRYVIVESGRVVTFDNETSASLESVDLEDPIDNWFASGEVSQRDGQIYVGHSDDGILCLDSDTLAVVENRNIRGSQFFHSVPNSDDYITLRNGSTLCRTNVETGADLWRVETRVNQVFCTHAFSAAFVALGEHAEDGKERIVLYDIESGKPSPTHIYHIKWIRGAVFSSDGSLLVTTGNDGFIRVYDINQNKFEWEHINDPDGAFAVSMHPNSDYIAVGCMRGIRIWSLKERRLVSSWRGHSWFVDCMTFSRDGKYLLSGSPDDTAALWRTTDVIGKFEYGKD